MAFASTANAGITIPAGDWTVDIGGNVNAYYSNTQFSGAAKSATAGGARSGDANTVGTGLLPSAVGIGAKTRQNDLDIAVQFTFFVGGSSSDSGGGAFNESGANLNSLNIRQAYMTFGDASWGTIKGGRDLGVFGSDAILSDMTLLGVGTGAGGAGSSTLGRIGSGYLYADWVGQIAYTTPNWNGLQATVAVREPWANSDNGSVGFEGKVTYDFAANDVTGRVWVGGVKQDTQSAQAAASTDYNAALNQFNNTGTFTNAGLTAALAANTTAAKAAHSGTAEAWEIGAKAAYQGASLVGYYYQGQNIGGNNFLTGSNSAWVSSGLIYRDNAVDNEVSGGYVQGTYTLPTIGTKLGLSWGESMSKVQAAGAVEFKSESWIVGAYHPLTKSLNLVAEYTHNDLTGLGGVAGAAGEGKVKTGSLGAILFF